jgi:AraC-like protein
MVRFTATNSEEWAEAASRAFVPLVTDKIGSSFSGSIDYRLLGSMGISRVVAGPCRVARTPRLIAQGNSKDVLFSLQVKGTSQVMQDERIARLGGTSGALYTATEPYVLDFHASTATYVMQVPSRHVPRHRGKVIAARALPVHAGIPAFRVYSRFIRALFEGSPSLDKTTSQVMARTATSLLAVVLDSVLEEHDISPRQSGALMVSIREFVRENIAESSLSTSEIGHRFGVSMRYVYRLFNEHNDHPAEFIRAERMKAAVMTLF